MSTEHEVRSGTIDELAETVGAAEQTEAIHVVQSAPDVCFTWDYERARPQLAKLYEKAKTSMSQSMSVVTFHWAVLAFS